jgi:indolepyruvate decarboxylase
MKTTVIQHVLSRLRDIGVRDIFGVAGDFAFPIDDAVSSDRNFRFVGACNELNGAYAADGNARIGGLAALCTTYGVGDPNANGDLQLSFRAGAPTDGVPFGLGQHLFGRY